MLLQVVVMEQVLVRCEQCTDSITGIAPFVGVLRGLLEPLPADLQQLWVWACCATRWEVDL
jgi:hypothetical protein